MTERSSLKRIDEYLEGTGRALRQDQTYEDLKTSTICLCNALQNIVSYLAGLEDEGQVERIYGDASNG